ncbi:pentatricopeptide repeat-containing protein [Dorcoceras hygrometricum]|uniref:Pentatricopeptide repeat-containing protein n=1 Tax=Dorcoceras hygrometricum TaxID=472368 RepID=A0A2Z7CBG2_9LAMI|nr:pentatricopeptide repeat-containing protein [Dorcoceras hygrometricum]
MTCDHRHGSNDVGIHPDEGPTMLKSARTTLRLMIILDEIVSLILGSYRAKRGVDWSDSQRRDHHVGHHIEGECLVPPRAILPELSTHFSRRSARLDLRLRGDNRGINHWVGFHTFGSQSLALPFSIIVLERRCIANLLKSGVEGDVRVGTSLVDMYGKCGDIVSSRKVFDYMPERNVVSWNAIIGGYVRIGDMGYATRLFEELEVRTSVTWNEMLVMVDGYARNGDMEAAEEVFEVMPEWNFYVCSVMVSGYFRKGDVGKGREFFDRMCSRNVVCWNSLIAGYAQNGMCAEAMDAFMNMRTERLEPDEVTIVSVLSVCAQSGILEVGKEIHEMIVQKGIDLNDYVVNGLVDMYAKCGDLGNAKLIFEGNPSKNYATWNSLITGFSIHGHCFEALELFMRMEESGIKPDGVTILSVLSACAHGGLVEEGLQVFSKMEQYGLTANTKHYGCVVDMLGRAGKLQEAMAFVEGMPVEANDTILGSLLGACQIHSDTVMAEKVLELVGKLNSDDRTQDDGCYVVLSKIF